jgi:hypothetical protein
MIDNIYILTGTALAILTVLMVAWLYWPEPQRDPPSEPVQSKPPKTKPKPQSASNRAKPPTISLDTIQALQLQADAERAIAEALQRKAATEPDPVKRARINRQAANSWVKFNTILDRVDKLTALQ